MKNAESIINEIVRKAESLGLSQKASILNAARMVQTALVLCAHPLKNLSVAHPATNIPSIPPTISIAPTTLAASVMSSPLNWVNMLEPQSNMVNRIMYTKKFDSAIIQITGFLKTSSLMHLLLIALLSSGLSCSSSADAVLSSFSTDGKPTSSGVFFRPKNINAAPKTARIAGIQKHHCHAEFE